MNTLTEFQVRNGILLETYSVEQDDDGVIFIHNVVDSDAGGPMDSLHIDCVAAPAIALALLRAARRINAPVFVDVPSSNVVVFPGGRV